MKQGKPAPRLLVISWGVAAILTYAGLLASLPGYYRWFVQIPFAELTTGIQRTLSLASGLASLLCALISAALATLLFTRKPGDRTAVFVSFFLLSYSLFMSGPIEMLEYMVFGSTGMFSIRIQSLVLSIPVFIFLMIFPNGVIVPKQSRLLIPLIVLVSVLMCVLPLDDLNTMVSPRSVILYSLIGILLLLSLGGQVYRYVRVSSPLERQQTKIVIFGLLIQFILLGYSSTFYYAIPPDERGLPPNGPLAYSVIWWIALAILPLSLTISVIRSHLWDIDVVIRRTLVYGFLTVSLGLIYLGSVVSGQYLFRIMAGHDSPLVIVVSTLVIAALFTPLRLRIQNVIDRRFFRSKYNAEQALMHFQHTLRDRIDLEQVESELSAIVQATVQPEWVSLWVREPNKRDV